jgi:hypothetical protein
MNLEGVDIFQAYTISGTTKMPAELALRYRLLRRRRQIADRHVLDHAAAKRADLSHRKTSCLKGLGCEKPTILSDRRRLLLTAPQLPRKRLRSIAEESRFQGLGISRLASVVIKQTAPFRGKPEDDLQ